MLHVLREHSVYVPFGFVKDKKLKDLGLFTPNNMFCFVQVNVMHVKALGNHHFLTWKDQISFRVADPLFIISVHK